jgi:hypothetical protein
MPSVRNSALAKCDKRHQAEPRPRDNRGGLVERGQKPGRGHEHYGRQQNANRLGVRPQWRVRFAI